MINLNLYRIQKIIAVACLFVLSPIILSAQGTWLQKANLPANRQYGVSFTINGKGYYGTGYNGLWRYEFWEYDVIADAWTQKADVPHTTSWGRGGAIGFSISGKGYIGLGSQSGGNLNDMQEYDPLLNTWTQKSNMPAVGRRYAIALVISNKAYLGTGSYSGPVIYCNDWWEYNPANDIWTQKNNFPFLRAGATAFAITNIGYVFGGGDGNNGFNDLWEYNAAADAWSQKSSLPDSARHTACSFVTANMGYIFGGEPGSQYTNDLWQYNPAANTWLAKAAMPADGRFGSSAFELNGKGYIVGGASNATWLSELWEYTPDSVYAGVNEGGNFSQIKVFPNPFKSCVQVNLPLHQSANYEVKLCDITGKIMYTGSVPAADINPVLLNVTSKLSKGVYLISIKSGNNLYNLSDKIVKL